MNLESILDSAVEFIIVEADHFRAAAFGGGFKIVHCPVITGTHLSKVKTTAHFHGGCEEKPFSCITKIRVSLFSC